MNSSEKQVLLVIIGIGIFFLSLFLHSLYLYYKNKHLFSSDRFKPNKTNTSSWWKNMYSQHSWSLWLVMVVCCVISIITILT